MATTQESYYESLGRQTQVPFSDSKLAYAEVEPDLTKAINDNIDKEIKDTAQFFDDNIKMFNASLKAKNRRWSDLASLTKDGRTIIENYKNHQDEKANLKKLTDLNKNKSWKTKFDAEGISLEEATGRNLLELNEEVGRAETSINEIGYYDTVDENDKPLRIYGNTDFEDMTKLVSSYDVINGRGTANEAERHYSEWLKTAKKSVTHENGLFWKDLTYPEKIEWKQSVDALYIKMWREKDPNLNDRLIIKTLLPKFETEDTKLFSSQSAISQDASKYVIGENSKMQGVQIIRSMSNSIISNDTYSANDKILVDEFYGETGWYQRRVAYHFGKTNDKKAANQLAQKDMRDMIQFGIDNNLLEEEHLDNLLTEWNFNKSDGSGLTSFANLNQNSKETTLFAQNYLNEKITKNNLITAQTRLNSFVEGLKDGKYMTQDDLNYFAQFPSLVERARAIHAIGEKGGMSPFEYAAANNALNKAFEVRAGDGTKFKNILDVPNPNAKSDAKDRIILMNYNMLKSRGTRFFLEQVEVLEKTMKDSDEINREALERTITALDEGQFDDAVSYSVGDVEYEDTKKVYGTNTALITKDPKVWLKSSELHFGESIYAFQGRDFLEFGGPAPAFYRELSKGFQDMDVKNVIYERLVAMKMIDPTDPKFAQYALRNKDKVNILESRLLTNYPDKSRALRFSIANVENWKERLKEIESTEALNHFDGTGAFKEENGDYSKTINLTTLPIVDLNADGDPNFGDPTDIFSLASQNPEAEFGKYRIKGKNLLIVLDYMNKKKLLKEGQQFNANFEGIVLKMRLKLDAHKDSVFKGDTSYLDMMEVSEEDQALFDKLVGVDGSNIPNTFNNLEFLIKAVVNQKVNTEL